MFLCSSTNFRPPSTRRTTIGCRKYLTVPSLLSGNLRLNFAFVANLFNTHLGLKLLDEQEDFDAEGEREARVFTLWLNSLGVDPAVHNLFKNLKDGLIILQAFDKIIPGSVVWRRANQPKATGPGFLIAAEGEEADEETSASRPRLTRFKAVENTNYAVELAKQNKLHIVYIQGADIVDGSKTLVLGLNISQTLQNLSATRGPISDTEMVKWANTTVQKHKSTVHPIRSFKDPSLTTGVFFLELLDAMQPGIVDFSMVSNIDESGDCEERRQNAKLAISIARKMGALIFLVPENIVDVRPRLILTFVGSLMSLQC
ncbi:hypothetical protein M422DRAFT_76823 [Sphaerobolus stellatus SS14]|uniref:Calponin-homology (CH) domain-containing protein n=1 Tax=Sphaerobolus stellatus (strain SS14) TaxID=990650 RepID=A0A0C9UI78_SPHS4|nr:hypothetical protein M422DRAFT_76823 [Sphaerobolus stellatus SS14]